jgi:HSP20 family molecular chaperone IbpA
MAVTRKAPRTPLAELALLQREMNQLFERLAEFDRPDEPAVAEWRPNVDVFECHGSLAVVVEVPGLAPESLKVVCRDHWLVITGERRERRPPLGDAVFLCVERPQGRFTRKVPLDMAVDVSRAEGHLAGGVLTIIVPRLKDRRGRETVIPVKREQNE